MEKISYNLNGLKKIYISFFTYILATLFILGASLTLNYSIWSPSISLGIYGPIFILMLIGLSSAEKYSASFRKAKSFIILGIIAWISIILFLCLLFVVSDDLDNHRVSTVFPFAFSAFILFVDIIIMLIIKNVVSGCVAIAGQNQDGKFGRSFVTLWVKFFAFYSLYMIFSTIFILITLRNWLYDGLSFLNDFNKTLIFDAFESNPIFGGASAVTAITSLALAIMIAIRIKATYDKFNGITIPEGLTLLK